MKTEPGARLLVEPCRQWKSLTQYDADYGDYEIREFEQIEIILDS